MLARFLDKFFMVVGIGLGFSISCVERKSGCRDTVKVIGWEETGAACQPDQDLHVEVMKNNDVVATCTCKKDGGR